MSEPRAATTEKLTAAYCRPACSNKSFFYTAELPTGEPAAVCVKVPRTKAPDYDMLFAQCIPPIFKDN